MLTETNCVNLPRSIVTDHYLLGPEGVLIPDSLGPANNQKEINMNKKTISGWALQVTWDDGKEETITEIDDETAGAVDAFLTELEKEKASLE